MLKLSNLIRSLSLRNISYRNLILARVFLKNNPIDQSAREQET
jgi:hypothetical protein